MTPQPPPERSPARERDRELGAPLLRRLARLVEPAASRQARRGARADDAPAALASPEEGPPAQAPDAPAAPDADPLEHPDAVLAADAAATENLLRCWVRERGVEGPDGDTLHVPLAASGAALRVPVRYWSATGWHRFGTLALAGAPAGAPPVDAVTLAALLGREAAHGGPAQPDQPAPPAGGHPVGESAELVARVADSARRTAAFLAARRAEPGPALHGDAFLDAEQSLILGHPLHPTPKSREGLADGDARRFSPELRGSFRLHWLAVDRAALAADSAWREEGAIVPATVLATRLAGEGLRLPPDTVPLPLHPWQAREVVQRPDVARLLADGALHDLGEHGEPWHPTSSVRTVHRPGAPAMLKLSLALRITNSRRENLRKELHRGVEVHRLLTGELGKRWHAAFPDGPGFGIVRDPAWLGVDDADGQPVPGLDVVVRHSPFGAAEDVACVASLTAPRPWPGRGEGELRSRLADVIGALAARTGRDGEAVAVEWLLRYLRAVVRPALWLDAEAGIALEAHQQNTLVLLDADGWPAGGRYRDNQGFYFRASHRASLDRLLPGIGEHSDTFVADDVATERFVYYLGINNVLGLIGAFGSQGLADEALLLAAFRRFLAEEAARGGAGGPVSPLPERLLQARTLRCKANLLTRLHGLDELVGPVDGQSVYVTIPNPLA
ncbi:IucA/IucC family protein [Streptomyces sp. 6N223]|uniref:IucA/IucC family protein n=1 Tax=Streptomyces sp. 6N223 TaxID=3457412 RepID=UPI003FD563AB